MLDLPYCRFGLKKDPMHTDRKDETNPFHENRTRVCAQQLFQVIAVWVDMIQNCLRDPNPSLLHSIRDDVFSFAMCLLELRGKENHNADQLNSFVAELKKEYASLVGEEPVNFHRILLYSGLYNESDLAGCVSHMHQKGEFPFELSEPMYQDFCQSTGLGSKALVGNGPNMAVLMFYILVFGRIYEQMPSMRGRLHDLIKTLRAGYLHLDYLLSQWMENKPVNNQMLHEFMLDAGLKARSLGTVRKYIQAPIKKSE